MTTRLFTSCEPRKQAKTQNYQTTLDPRNCHMVNGLTPNTRTLRFPMFSLAVIAEAVDGEAEVLAAGMFKGEAVPAFRKFRDGKGLGIGHFEGVAVVGLAEFGGTFARPQREVEVFFVEQPFGADANTADVQIGKAFPFIHHIFDAGLNGAGIEFTAECAFKTHLAMKSRVETIDVVSPEESEALDGTGRERGVVEPNGYQKEC